MITTATAATANAADLGALPGILLAVVLLILLAAHELAKVGGSRARMVARHLLVAIAPLLITFAAVWTSRMAHTF